MNNMKITLEDANFTGEEGLEVLRSLVEWFNVHCKEEDDVLNLGNAVICPVRLTLK